MLGLQKQDKWSVWSRSLHLLLPLAVVFSLWNSLPGSSCCTVGCLPPEIIKGSGSCGGGDRIAGAGDCLLQGNLTHSHQGCASPASTAGPSNGISTVCSPHPVSNAAFSPVRCDWCPVLSGGCCSRARGDEPLSWHEMMMCQWLAERLCPVWSMDCPQLWLLVILCFLALFSKQGSNGSCPFPPMQCRTGRSACYRKPLSLEIGDE